MTKRQRTRFRFDAPEDDRSTDGIRFRPGRDFGEWLSEFGRIYGISRGETAKRLAICALKWFVAKDHFDLLDKLHRVHVEKYGPKRESFMLMCAVARKSLDAKFAEIDVAKGGIFEGGFTPAETTKMLQAVLEIHATGEPVDLTLVR